MTIGNYRFGRARQVADSGQVNVLRSTDRILIGEAKAGCRVVPDLDFFIAYKDDDQERAHEVKTRFEKLGHSAFVARYDILLSKDWRQDIRQHLDSCTALIAIVTENFRRSPYANQEVGVIVGKRKPVISFKFGDDLPGLLDDYQALSMSENSVEQAVQKAIEAVEERQRTETQLPRPIASLSIRDKADQLLDQKIASFKNDWPSLAAKPYRRVLVRADEISPSLFTTSLDTDDWFYNNHPRILDFADRQATQHGLVFTSNSPRHAEVAYDSGELYYGELIRGVDGVNIGRTALVLGQMSDYARRAFDHFHYQGRVSLEFKAGNVRNQALRDDSILSLWGENYIARDNEITVARTVVMHDLADIPPQVVPMIIEFCRAFGFSFAQADANNYVRSILTQYAGL